jgi:hypothetical protein
MIQDMRGRIPTQADNGGIGTGYLKVAEKVYGRRELAGISMITLHYTASPPTGSIAGIARAQLERVADPSDGTKFPGLAYTYIVDGSGVPYLAWDVDVRVWHSAAPGKNSHSVGICYIGDVEPNAAQLLGLRAAIAHAKASVGRDLVVGGHKDDYATECPGPKWPGWKAAVLG